MNVGTATDSLCRAQPRSNPNEREVAKPAKGFVDPIHANLTHQQVTAFISLITIHLTGNHFSSSGKTVVEDDFP
jgi:hypothetical protein